MQSKAAAVAVPVVACAAGALSTLAVRHEPVLQPFAQGLSVIVLGLAGLVWLWLDAKEQKQSLPLALALGAIIAPVVAIPYYFNQTRERGVRATANVLFMLTAISAIAGYWLGCAIASGAP
jgi:hypothetical protein